MATGTATSLTTLLARLRGINLAMGKLSGTDALVLSTILLEAVVLWKENQ